jgi:hypothetical protein
LHTALRRMFEVSDKRLQTILVEARTEIYNEVKKLGGKVTVEHGVGLTRAKDLCRVQIIINLNL